MLDGNRLGLGRHYRRLFGLSRSPEEERPRARTVCIASGKGGTGKSILATNLAVSLAARGERVVLVDFDAGLANAHLLLGLAPGHDLSHVLSGEISAQEALIEGPHGMRLLSGGVGRHVLANPTRRELDRLFAALDPLEERFDLVLVDHGAGLGYATLAHLAAAQSLLLVTNHEVTALSDGYAFFKRAVLVNPGLRVGVCMNRAPDRAEADAAWERFRSVSRRFLDREPEWAGWVPWDEAVARSVARRAPVVVTEPESRAALEILRVAGWPPFLGDSPRVASPADRPASWQGFFQRARAALR